MGKRLSERFQSALLRSQDVTLALRTILLMSAAGALVSGVNAYVYDDRAGAIVGGLGLAVVGSLWWLAAQGRTTLAAILLVVLFDGITVYGAVSGAGIRDAALMIFPLIIITSGVLFNRRLALGFSTMVFLSGVGLGVAEMTGVVVTRFSHLTGVSDVINIAVLLAVATGLVDVLASAVRNGIKRTRELQEQVQQAEKLRAVGLLARGVAHDFNNQLTGILGNASLLERKLPPDTEWSSYVQSIVQCSQRSADLTRQLMAFARKGRRQNDVIDMDDLVESVRSLLSRSIDKRISLVHVPSEEKAVVRGDSSFLQSAVLNLALNARDAMPDGGRLRFVVEVCQSVDADSEQRGRWVRLRVEDTGLGMTPEVLEHVFEPFFTTREEGNGMGLAAVHGTVEAHDGSIEVESKPGVGTTFTMSLPYAEGAVLRDSSEPRSVGRRFPGVRVLLAEDEQAVATAAVALLEELGCQVTHCSHGARALEEFQKHPERFDLVLLDNTMPHLSGDSVMRALREKNPKLPIISTSGYAESAPNRQAPKPDAFLAKPFDLVGLSSAIGNALGRSR